jgi:antitoxin YefM
MDETEYIMSSPKMVEIIRQGEEDIKNGNFKVMTLDEIWK